MAALGCVAFGVFGLFQFWAAFLGMVLYTGTFWPFVIFAACIMTRFALPITIFSFFGAWKVWEWDWYWAALFAAPGLALVVPGILAGLVGNGKNMLWRQS